MLRMRWHLGLSMLLALTPLHAFAQRSPSAQQLEAGNELLAAGDVAYREHRFAEALSNFEQAYRRLQQPEILFRIGECAAKVGDHDRAVNAYQSFLNDAPEAPERAVAERQLQAERDALAQQALSPEAAAKAPGESPAAPPQAASAEGKTDLKRAWWLWAGAGAVALGGIILAAVLVGSSSSHEQRPVQGNTGGVVMTLEAR